MFFDLMCIILKAKPKLCLCASGHWGCSCRNTRPRSQTTSDNSSGQKVVTGSLMLLEVKKTFKFSLFELAKRLHNVYLICMHSICKAGYFHVLQWVNFLLLLIPASCLGRMVRTTAKELSEPKKRWCCVVTCWSMSGEVKVRISLLAEFLDRLRYSRKGS